MLIAVLVSGSLLLGALFFQYVFGLAPCALCIWQRWPHGAAVVFAGLGLWKKPFTYALPLIYAASAGIAGFHTGVEYGWWEGLSTCGGAAINATNTADLLAVLQSAPVVRCEDVPWKLGLSMAGWNALISFIMIFYTGRQLWTKR